MKNKIIIVLILFTTLNLQAQSTFEKIYYDTEGLANEVRFIGETSDHGYVMLCRTTKSFNSSVNHKIIRLSSDGEYAGELDYRIQDSTIAYVSLFNDPDNYGQYLAIASVKAETQSNVQKLIILNITENLDVIDCKEIGFENIVFDLFATSIPQLFMDSHDNILFSTQAMNFDSQYCYLFARISKEAHLVDYGIENSFNRFGDVDDDFFECRSNPLKYGLLKGSVDNEIQLYTLDSLLNCTFVRNLTDDTLGDGVTYTHFILPVDQPKIQRYDDSTFFMTSLCVNRGYNNWNYVRDNGVLLTKLNSNFELTDYALIGAFNDTMERPALAEPMSIKGDYLYHTSVFNYREMSQSYPSCCVINKYDTDLNLVWKRYCRNDKLCIPRTVLATEDGGCIVAGICYEPLYLNDGAMYAVKVNENGYLSVPENESDKIRPYFVYPNPCKDFININISPDVKCVKAEVFDVNGKLVKLIEEDINKIDIQTVTSGNYILRLIFDDGVAYSEKVVVE